MPPQSSEDIQHLGDELLSDPSKNMNNIIHLKRALDVKQPKDSTIAAVRGLKVFFSDASEKGDLNALSLSSTLGPDSEDPQNVYRAWLSRQYSDFVNHLLRLIEKGASPEVQVAAVAALMEGVRGYERSGTFEMHLYSRTVQALVASRGAAAEALSYLITAFLPNVDVRFYTVRFVAKLATELAAGASQAANSADDEHGDEDADKRRRLSRANGDVSHRAPTPDLRCMYDVLANVPPEFDADALKSWCGADTAAARGGVESSQKRRKRKRLEAGGDAGSGGGKPVKWASAVLQRRAWSNAWLALLRLPLPPDILKKVLVKMHADIIPHLTNPHLLTDFLSATLDAGGLNGMLALHGIFTLVTKHGLEYPNFYRRLYTLLTPAALMAKQRARFFQLADVFLSSSLVPAYTVAAFAKRFARLALASSPAGAMIAIAFVHNLLRRHPSCNVLLHKPYVAASVGAGAVTTTPQPTSATAIGSASAAGNTEKRPEEAEHTERPDASKGQEDGSSQQEGNVQVAGQAGGLPIGQDPYNVIEEDPAASRAIESSLWELDSLRDSYCPQVAALATVLDKDLTDRKRTAEMDLAPLLTGSYSSLVSAELARRLKQVPIAFYPRRLTGVMDTEACKADFLGWALH